MRRVEVKLELKVNLAFTCDSNDDIQEIMEDLDISYDPMTRGVQLVNSDICDFDFRILEDKQVLT